MFPPQDHFFECIITFGILLADLSTNCQSLPHFSAKRVDFTLNAQVTANPISAKVEFAFSYGTGSLLKTMPLMAQTDHEKALTVLI